MLQLGSRIGVYCVVLWLCLTGTATADPITISIQGLASGSIGATGFSDTLFLIEIEADTDNAFSPIAGVWALPTDSRIRA